MTDSKQHPTRSRKPAPRLELRKETLVELDDAQLEQVAGGKRTNGKGCDKSNNTKCWCGF